MRRAGALLLALALVPLAAARMTPGGETAPVGVDGAVSLDALAERLASCARDADPEVPGCRGVLYLWTPRMPLSRLGMAEAERAATALELSLDRVASDPLGGEGGAPRTAAGRALAERLAAAGATLHAPALVVHEGGRFLGGAVLGYKVADAYRGLIEARLAARAPEAGAADAAEAAPAAPLREWRDYPVPGTPGAYFRWVPGHDLVAFETAGRVQLLDLESGERLQAPGNVDFVPTPDGRFFVTPSQRRTLDFYDADAVLAAARAGRGREVPPFHSDAEMRDQYPSVGILETAPLAGGGSRTVYRVLTSWFERVAFRDYEITTAPGVAPQVRALGPVRPACRGLAFSTPILSPDGREVAGRDEESGTTKIYRLADDGGCEEAADLRLPTGKVAWSPDRSRVAFAIPEGAVRDGRGTLWSGRTGEDGAGIFVHRRAVEGVERVEASEAARRLTFPEFVGNDRVIFLLPGEASGTSRFRLVCCLP